MIFHFSYPLKIPIFAKKSMNLEHSFLDPILQRHCVLSSRELSFIQMKYSLWSLVVILLCILAVIDKKMLLLQQLTFKIESLKFENNHILSKLLLGLLLDKSFDFLTRTSFLSNFFCHDCGMKKQFQYEIIDTLKHHYWSFSRREACK